MFARSECARLARLEDILLTTKQRLRKAGISDNSIRSYLTNLRLYLGCPPSTSLEKRKVAARNLVQFEINQLPVHQRARLTKADIESSVTSQMHEVLTRREQHYLRLNPAVYYQNVSCPIRWLFSEPELEGLLSKRLAVVKKVVNVSQQTHPIRLVKNADHNLITTNKHPQTVSSAFIKIVVEEARKSI